MRNIYRGRALRSLAIDAHRREDDGLSRNRQPSALALSNGRTWRPCDVVATAVGRNTLMLARTALAAAAGLALVSTASAGTVVSASWANGLAAEAEFTLVSANQLQIRLKNTSAGSVPGYTGANALLTSVAFDLGAAGSNATDPAITGGNVKVGSTSLTVNFSVQNRTANQDVSGEWGYGNTAQSGLLTNFVTAMAAGSTPFGGTNLDGPDSLDGPQGGIMAWNATTASLGGLGAVKDEVVITVNLSKNVSNLNFLNNGVRFEFGCDAAFLNIPTPGAAAIAGVGLLAGLRRRRR
jgi:uncharacterized protein (TIGR03382 family)